MREMSQNKAGEAIHARAHRTLESRRRRAGELQELRATLRKNEVGGAGTDLVWGTILCKASARELVHGGPSTPFNLYFKVVRYILGKCKQVPVYCNRK